MGPCPFCNHCKGGICSTGTDPASYHQCPVHWTGFTCKEYDTCPDGRWGGQCDKSCQKGCTSCSRETGICSHCMNGGTNTSIGSAYMYIKSVHFCSCIINNDDDNFNFVGIRCELDFCTAGIHIHQGKGTPTSSPNDYYSGSHKLMSF